MHKNTPLVAYAPVPLHLLLVLGAKMAKIARITHIMHNSPPVYSKNLNYRLLDSTE